MKILDLGCGNDLKRCYPGSIRVDANPDAKPDIVWDLDKYPYPFDSNSIDIIQMSHSIEHLDDIVKCLNELWRILKVDGKLIIKVPHYSGNTAYWLLHKWYFCVNCFNDDYDYGHSFKKEKVKLHWLVYREKYPNKIISGIIDLFANISPKFTERLWCYWVGGFDEIEYHLRKREKQERRMIANIWKK